MFVYPCFDGDVDMALAWLQHDLYFADSDSPEWATLGGGSTLGWIWAHVMHRCAIRRSSIPWVDRNFDRLDRITGFSHKLLQVPHEHIAAYFRWTTPRIERGKIDGETAEQETRDLMESWKSFLRREIPDLLRSDAALVALAKSILYQLFDAGDAAYEDFQDILMRRYGFECVETTGWALEVAERVRLTSRRDEDNARSEVAAHDGADRNPNSDIDRDGYGCPACWPTSAEAAWAAGLKLHDREALIDDSHFNARVATCSKCGQAYLWVFTELIDWQHGDDSQGWCRVPLTAAEARELLFDKFKGNDGDVYRIGEGRRSLWRIHPRGGTDGYSWGLGVAPLPHD
jgi:hypothetical protein